MSVDRFNKIVCVNLSPFIDRGKYRYFKQSIPLQLEDITECEKRINDIQAYRILLQALGRVTLIDNNLFVNRNKDSDKMYIEWVACKDQAKCLENAFDNQQLCQGIHSKSQKYIIKAIISIFTKESNVE